MCIEVTLETLLESIGKETLIIDEDNNVVSREFDLLFSEPVIEDVLINFEKQNNCILPKDYKKVLSWSNGFLFREYENVQLYKLEYVEDFYINYKDGFYIIGSVLGCYVGINSSEVSNGEYMYAQSIGENYFIKLYCDFKTFLSRVTLSKENYWDWFKDQEKYYFEI